MISRVLSALLLVFVLYGTTIEAAHRHGRILTSGSFSTTTASPTQNAGDVGSSRNSCSECLICQLQQHFSTSLVIVRLKYSPPLTLSEIFHPATKHFRTRTVITQTGRGPPLVS